MKRLPALRIAASLAVLGLGAGLGSAAGAAPAPGSSAPPAGAKAPAKPAAHTIVLCAPGYPGNTAQAQPAMDAFARALEKAAGWPAGELGAVYYETEGGGLERMRKPDVALAITTLPFYFADGAKAGLTPRLQAVRNGSPSQTWSLIAKKERVHEAADMDGWELTGPAGYAPGFVQMMLQGWGPLRSSTRITFAPAPLAALRRVNDGEDVAVLLEPEQVQAIFPKNPLANALEIVMTTKPVPGSIASAVRGHDESATAKILAALPKLQGSAEGAEALKTLRIEKFVGMDDKTAAWLERSASEAGALKK